VEKLKPAARRSLTAPDDVGMIDQPVRDKRYRFTALGRVVADYLSWKEIEDGAAAPPSISTSATLPASVSIILAWNSRSSR
jgi:hypothetical protein